MAVQRGWEPLCRASRVYLIDPALFALLLYKCTMALYKLAIRVDKAVDRVIGFFGEKVVPGFGVREVAGENEHWHFYVETALKPNSFRAALRRKIEDLVGNGAYSVAECRDVDKYLRYMSKGDGPDLLPEIVWKFGPMWTDEKVEELHQEYWAENAAMKKRRTESVVDVVIDRCKALRIAWDDRSYIAEEYIKELVERSKPINIYSVKSAVNLIQIKLCPDDSAIKQLASQVHI